MPEDWERRARECERARSQILARIDAARREVYDLNLRAEQTEAVAAAALEEASRLEAATAAALERVEHADAVAKAALDRASQLEAATAAALERVEHADAVAKAALDRASQSEAAATAAEAELRQALRERDAILSSTIWQATVPVRMIANYASATLRRLRSGR